jgi:triosephosphate isomerase (TIM)
MKKQPFLFVANWKMEKSFQESALFIRAHSQELNALVTQHTEIVICPSFVALSLFMQHCKSALFSWGAQDCSTYFAGPYTGQVDALSLKELGCRYTIIGHSERRTAYSETNEQIAHKAMQLAHTGIIPIVCIGETLQEFQSGKTTSVLASQLLPLLETITRKETATELVIAYEPLWAIGSGTVPNASHLKNALSSIKTLLDAYCITYKLIYGGSVNEQTITRICTTELVQGVLIGSASLDFKKLKNIVSLHQSTYNKEQ